MVSAECFSEDYIEQQSRIMTGASPVMIEKCIHALALLCHLTETDLEFIFKGGTSLLLHLPEIRRLSIDIDIICNADNDKINGIVDSLSSLKPFVRQKEDDRGARGLPERRHFKFFYTSAVTGREDNVLLDVVQEADCRLECLEKPIETSFIQVDHISTVRVPTVDALLGDKLTAFAPNTQGVPFFSKRGKSMTMQVVKQLYDVGELFNEVQDLSAVKRAYAESYRLESSYNEDDFSMQQTLDDTKRVSLQLCCNAFRYADRDDEIIANIQDGISRVRDHLAHGRFRITQEAKIAAAKAYLLASYLEGSVELTPAQLLFNLDGQMEFIQGTNITAPSCLNRLKPILPEAFYYLALALGE
ncbi:nucleotidyl transferase AbiEii/AbiGii toxin family protein [Pontiella sulfatireligans]|uniref:Nucleotidyl transferase AbiEii/AbiGii toxin family protein n=1 Tax=Pontiella sulfatireligans TaxID=2750658 RepID=A0A6C2UQ83_9BACT|nr:nucleotidyl transferase AbiEii/AbiGii toxin family protein [Pontiella sulfatireligans]VGO21467.1 hypothetical protein SCARR_03541 [Pontiella sulfatireligans]